MLILGIESSCDETAAAVVRDGREILSSVISSQIEMHKPFGGVVPELASREHLEKIEPIVSQALERAGVTLGQIEAIAVTKGPGLIGSLLVGVCYAKALAFGLGGRGLVRTIRAPAAHAMAALARRLGGRADRDGVRRIADGAARGDIDDRLDFDMALWLHARQQHQMKP